MEFSGLTSHYLSSQLCFRSAYHVKGNVLPGLDKTLTRALLCIEHSEEICFYESDACYFSHFAFLGR